MVGIAKINASKNPPFTRKLIIIEIGSKVNIPAIASANTYNIRKVNMLNPIQKKEAFALRS